MRRGKQEHLVTTGKFEGKRSRGRQREKIMDGLATWLGPVQNKVISGVQALRQARAPMARLKPATEGGSLQISDLAIHCATNVILPPSHYSRAFIKLYVHT
ncbi:hypothetical protein PoB_003994500 [Plakobranchus ocellatus]|uniref:Uncharacterized protein n=1 Tax=Plakobranchus ocellatus TaxID=259542 RepID=A0AAV4B2Z5_9GAST|nr:hypothetical protein PoB_003994500 [Plakobranchus ocellatus]